MAEILKALSRDPFSIPFKKVKGRKNLYSIRLGEYRIIYEVNTAERLVAVLKVGKRSRAYRPM